MAVMRWRATSSRIWPADQRSNKWVVWPQASIHGSFVMKATWAKWVDEML